MAILKQTWLNLQVEGCGEQFVAEPLLTLHSVNKHRPKDELYSCQYCGWTTNDKRTLVCHETRHSAKKVIACPYCDYKTNENRSHSFVFRDKSVFGAK